MQSEIHAAFERTLALPFGKVIAQILDRLSFASLARAFFGEFDAKLAMTRADGEVHSFAIALPAPAGQYVVRCIVYPTAAAAGVEQARNDFAQPAGFFERLPDFIGVLHFAIFAASDPPEMAIAWRPALEANIPDPELRNVVIPWKFAPAERRPEPVPVDGAAIVGMAEAVNDLKEAMHALLAIWPDEGGPIVAPGLTETREELSDAIAAFNRAAACCRLVHRMPVNVRDETWLPHNLCNALEFGSVEATMRAELARLYGSGAAALFAHALALPEGGDAGALWTRAEAWAVEKDTIVSPAEPAEDLDAFICYSWMDKTRGARDVYEFVTRLGLTAWLDEEQRLGTDSLDAQIAAAIGRARFVLACFSQEMFTGGGYALRELLFVATAAPQRCILVMLDRSPIPKSLAGLATVEWSRKTGPEELEEVLRARSVPHEALRATSLMASGGALAAALLRQVRRPEQNRRTAGEVELRAVLHAAMLDVVDHQADWPAIVRITDELKARQCWPAMDSTQLRDEPTVIRAVVRLRFSLFRAEVQLGAAADWKVHNRAAFELLEDLLALDLEWLRPAPAVGWLADDCRIALRDCLDAFEWAKDWLAGWSPDLLTDLCDVPREQTRDVEERMRQKTAEVADRMLALRLLEDTSAAHEPVISWIDLWDAVCGRMQDVLRNDAQSPLGVYFQSLGSLIDDEMVSRLAVRISDGVYEELRARPNARYEVIETAGAARIRFALRCHRAVRSKAESVKTVLGTVLKDLGDHDGSADLTVLVSTFFVPDVTGEWRLEVAFNVLPHPRPQTPPGALPFQAPFFRLEMLTDEELASLRAKYPHTIYEEL